MKYQMVTRALQMRDDLCALTYSDINNAIDYSAWLNSYVSYVNSGGERPPHKPPTA